METPLISVIIPVYNTQEYLNRCIDSVLSQMYSNFELLLVDDGSTDSSSSICDEYAKRDKRVKVFHKKNGGVSSARNYALEKVCGEWIYFMDSDDYISHDFFEINGNYDVIQKSYTIIDDKDNITFNKHVHRNIFFSHADIECYYVRNRKNALWDKIIKKEIVGDVRFNESISIGEDFYFFLSLIPKINSYFISDIGCYYYRKRLGSAMTSVADKNRRLTILFDNMENVKNLEVLNASLKWGIISGIYLYNIFRLSAFISNEQRVKTDQIIREISWNKLVYLSFEKKLKLLFFFLLYKFKF